MHTLAWRLAWVLVISSEVYLLYLSARMIPAVANALIPNRRIGRALKGLVDVFDSGTAVVDDKYVLGSFQGRSAWVSRTSDRSDLLYISMRGRFSLPFEVRTFRLHRFTGIRDIAMIIALLVTWSSFLFPWDGYTVFYHITFDNLLQYGCWVLLQPAILSSFLQLGLYRLRRRGTNRVEAQLAREPLTVATTEPDRFRTALDQPQIRESLTHLFDSCHADGVKAPADGFNSVGAFWHPSAIAVKKHVLDKDAVRETLTELSSLCAAAEQLYPKPV